MGNKYGRNIDHEYSIKTEIKVSQYCLGEGGDVFGVAVESESSK
jgi:hypothetical protein